MSEALSASRDRTAEPAPAAGPRPTLDVTPGAVPSGAVGDIRLTNPSVSERLASQAPVGEVPLESPDTLAAASPALEEAAFLRARYPIRLGGKVKTLRFQRVDGELRLGINPSWTQLYKNVPRVREIIEAATQGHLPKVSGAKWGEFNAELTKLAAAQGAYEDARDAREAAREPAKKKQKTSKDGPARADLTAIREATTNLELAVNQLVAYLRANFQDVVDEASDEGENLLGTTGKVLPPVANAWALKYYATGADKKHAIPIVWYKAPSDYDPIAPQQENGARFNVARFGAFYIHQKPGPTGGTKRYRANARAKRIFYASSNGAAGASDVGTAERFGVADANRPNNAAFYLKKTKHDSDRGNQRRYNDLFTNVGVPMGDASGLDGDHVLDLGFGGEDAANNYWPLTARINRRAFNGYNSEYKVHFIQEKGGQRELKMQAIGAMYGKWFKPKAFLASTDGSVPAESGTRNAGVK
jgi:hypothetical protein